jgi:hypothetical protein
VRLLRLQATGQATGCPVGGHANPGEPSLRPGNRPPARHTTHTVFGTWCDPHLRCKYDKFCGVGRIVCMENDAFPLKFWHLLVLYRYSSGLIAVENSFGCLNIATR